MNCIEIIIKHLKDNGFDGLRSPDGECGCEIDDLAPCGEIPPLCNPGYKVIVPKGVKSEYDFYICKSKEDRPWEWEWE